MTSLSNNSGSNKFVLQRELIENCIHKAKDGLVQKQLSKALTSLSSRLSDTISISSLLAQVKLRHP